MYYKTLSNNNNNEEVVVRIKADTLVKSLYYRDEGNVRAKLATEHATGCNKLHIQMTSTFFSTLFQMNIVISLFAAENDEKRVIRFKKIPADDTSEL